MCVVFILVLSLLFITSNEAFRHRQIGTRRYNFDISMANIERTRLGNSDLVVSKICLGTMTWGQQNSDEEAMEQLDYAFSNSINFLDTAEMYPVPTKAETQGRTDNVIGKWLSQKGRVRSDVILATKVAGASDFITWLPGRNGKGSRVRRSDIIVSVDESLKRLKTDYIDLIQIHWPDRYVPIFGADGYDITKEREYVTFEEQLLAFEELRKAGKIRYLGLSNETPYGVLKFQEARKALGLTDLKIISIQNSYSTLVRADFESSLIEVCSPRHENIGLLAYSPLAGGMLTGKYLKEDCPKSSRFNLFTGYMERYKSSFSAAAVKAYVEVAEKHGLTPTQLALGWCYNQPHVASTIIGATSIPQLKENIDAYETRDKVADPAVLADIAAVYARYRDPSKTAKAN